jgi:ligand-binding sensor domain-containing protein
LLPNNRDFDLRPTKSQPAQIDIVTNAFTSIVADEDGNKWIGMSIGAARIDLSEPDSLIWKIFTDATTLSNRSIFTMTRDGDDNLWFGDQLRRGTVQMSSNWLTFTREDGLGSDVVNALAEDKAGQIWAGTRSGISKLNSTRWTNFRLSSTGGVSRAEVTAITIDSTQTMWMGTFSGGVVRVPPGAKPNDLPPITTFYTVANTNGGLADNRIWDIALFRNEVWFATQGGVSLFLPDSNKWQKYTTVDSLIDNDARSIAIDKNGTVWCGTIGGISRYDRKKWGSFTTSDTDSLSGNFINDILIDDQAGEIWFATNGNGVSRYNKGRWRAPFSIKHGLADNRVNALLKTKNPAGIWFGTSNGASFRSANGTWTTVKRQHGLGENHVKSLLEDQNRRIWFGSFLRGVTRYTRKSNRPTIQLLNRFDVTTSAEILYNFVGSDLGTATPFLRYAYALDNPSQYSPWTFDTFARIVIPKDGMHTFYVKTIDTDGNESEPATDTFCKISPKVGSSTVLIDSIGFGNLKPVKISLYWPPNQLPDTFQVEIAPVSPDSLQSPALLAYAFKPFSAHINKKGVVLGFEFPPPSANPNAQYAVYRDFDARGRRDTTIVGGTQQKVDDGRIRITTAIDQFGLYAVRIIEGPGKMALARVTAQPRIFSPKGGGHGEATTLSFHLPQSAHVRVRVYNLAGRLVETIWDEPMNAGINAVAWDGKDQHHRFCPSGLYIMVIESNGFQSPPKPVKVMVLNE